MNGLSALFPISVESEIEAIAVDLEGRVFLQLEERLAVLDDFSLPARTLYLRRRGEQLIAALPGGGMISTEEDGELLIFREKGLIGSVREGLHVEDEFFDSVCLNASGQQIALWARRDEDDPFGLSTEYFFTLLSPLPEAPFLRVERLPWTWDFRPRDWTIGPGATLYVLEGGDGGGLNAYSLSDLSKAPWSIWADASWDVERCVSIAGRYSSKYIVAFLGARERRAAEVAAFSGEGLRRVEGGTGLPISGVVEDVWMRLSPDGSVFALGVALEGQEQRTLTVVSIDEDSGGMRPRMLCDFGLDTIVAWFSSNIVMIGDQNALSRRLVR